LIEVADDILRTRQVRRLRLRGSELAERANGKERETDKEKGKVPALGLQWGCLPLD